MSVLSSEFQLKSRENYDIFGIHTRPLKGSKKCVILCHGTCSNMNECNNAYVYLAKALAEAGYGVLRFDFIGCGKSEVDYIHYTLKCAVSDTQDVMRYAQSLGYEILHLLGWSQGGTVVLLSADDRITSLITLAGASDLSIMVQKEKYQLAKQHGYHWYDPGYTKPVRLSKEWYEDVLSIDVLKEYEKHSIPTLAIHGLQDNIVDPKYSTEIIKASHHPDSKVVLIEHANHIFNLLDEEYRTFDIVVKETLDWLNAY